MRIAIIGNGEKLMLTDIAHEIATIIVEGAILQVNKKLYKATVMSGDTAELIEISYDEFREIHGKNCVNTMFMGGKALYEDAIEHLCYEPEIKKEPVKFYDHFYKQKNRRR